jgi:hypothetical protein
LSFDALSIGGPAVVLLAATLTAARKYFSAPSNENAVLLVLGSITAVPSERIRRQ